jgi:hypothetical protein
MERRRVRTFALAALVALAAVTGAVAQPRPQPAGAVATYYDAGGREGTVYRLYRAYFLREPDQKGFANWYISTYQGWSLDRISQFFASSDEFETRYGSLGDAGFMDLIYRNVMGRAPDSTGYGFWVGELGKGMNRGSVMLKFSDSPEYKARTGGGVPPSFRAGTNARALLYTLTVVNETFRSGYDRDLFRHWDDEDGNGCNTRCEVLRRERRPDGRWFSIWDGKYVSSEGEIQMDHVVALSEAWYSGANTWDDARRDAFADWQVNLAAVTGAVNQAKDNEDAARWTPPWAPSTCAFAEITVTTKATWDLAVDPAEKAALARMLTGCTSGSANPPAPPTSAPPTTPPPPPSGCRTAGVYIAANGICVADYVGSDGDVDCPQLPAAAKPVRVPNPANDPYGLDGNDNDGWGCESG